MARQKNISSDNARLSCSCRDTVVPISFYNVFLHFCCAVLARSTSQMMTEVENKELASKITVDESRRREIRN